MNDTGFDPAGTAHRALVEAVATHGSDVLTNPDLLHTAFSDYWSDAPIELNALETVARAHGVQSLASYLQQRLDADTAVRLTCSTLQQTVALERTIATWAVEEFARILGHQVTSPGPVVPDRNDFTEDVTQDNRTVDPIPKGNAKTLPGRPEKTRSKRRLIGSGLSVMAILAYGLVGHSNGWIPFTAGSSGTNTTTSRTTLSSLGSSTTGLPRTTPSSLGTSTTGLLVQHPQVLAALMPKDFLPSCGAVQSLPKGLEAATSSYGCNEPSLGKNGEVYAYQFASRGAFENALQAYDIFNRFDRAHAPAACPPQGSSTTGVQNWNGPRGDSGVLECFTATDKVGNLFNSSSFYYVWTVPADYAILKAVDSADSSFAGLEHWWQTEGVAKLVTSGTP